MRYVNRLQLRVVVASVLAASVVIGAVVCAAFDWAIVASVLAISALGAGAWLYHSVERMIVARRISTVRTAATPFMPLLSVMAAIMGLTQAVVRALTDVTDNETGRDVPVWRMLPIPRGNRPRKDGDELEG